MPTLKEYRYKAADEIGPFHHGTATGGSTVAVLEDATWPVKNNADVEDTYVDQFLYRPAAAAADRERGIHAYSPASGLLTPDFAWGVAAVAGEEYEIHGVVPPSTLHRYVNAALKRIPLVVEFAVSPPDDTTRRISLATAAPWLKNKDWVRQVGVLGAGLSRGECTPTRVVGEAVQDGATVYLDCLYAFNPTDTIYVVAVKPAYDHCRPAGGAFGDQAGLALDTDEAVPVVELVATGAAAEAWQDLSRLLGDEGARRALKDLSLAGAKFTSEARRYFSLPELTFRKVKAWGPRR